MMGFAVLGENKRLPFLELADLLGRTIAMSSPEEVRPAIAPGLPCPSGDPYLPDRRTSPG
jgi:hypothetical protein